MKPNPTSYAEVMAELGPDARIVCIRDHAGKVLRGEEPPKEFSLSAEFLEVALTMGFKEKRK